jgi:hypothetical protein
MSTTFHFDSALEITPAILDIIKTAYREQPVSLYVCVEKPYIPQWQMEEVRKRETITSKNPISWLDFNQTIEELNTELEMA